jgi:hypothetical protein
MIQCKSCGAKNNKEWGKVCRMCGDDLPIPQDIQEQTVSESDHAQGDIHKSEKQVHREEKEVHPAISPILQETPSKSQISNIKGENTQTDVLQIDTVSGEIKQEILLKNQSRESSTNISQQKAFFDLDNLLKRHLKPRKSEVNSSMDKELMSTFATKEGEESPFVEHILIDKKIKEFAKKFDIEAVLVIDDESLFIGYYYQDTALKDLLENCLPYFLTLNDRFSDSSLKNSSDDHMEIHRFGKTFIFKELIMAENLPQFYLLLIKKKTKYNKEELDEFINFLKDALF